MSAVTCSDDREFTRKKELKSLEERQAATAEEQGIQRVDRIRTRPVLDVGKAWPKVVGVLVIRTHLPKKNVCERETYDLESFTDCER